MLRAGASGGAEGRVSWQWSIRLGVVLCWVGAARGVAWTACALLERDRGPMEAPKEVWRWLELWDKAPPRVPGRASLGSERVYNTNKMGTSLTSAGEDHLRIEVQKDGTMAVVCLNPALELVRVVREPESGTPMGEDAG
ncbi:hypothetical protein NDU88_007994 [Pleurodeles waltl]|uniref:Uncharacterized protein n=1 Tax=Pleurodeles waltl TaxID=8319 RepID=A0AAV7STY4_PLEWA|nr:hypothetical protein NDU88_007994 [Pleurodeles waltl]